MALLDEPEILEGTRAWDESQVAFTGAPDPAGHRYDVECTWYDVDIEDTEGAFCLIRIGSELEALVGEVVRVERQDRPAIFVYCLGGEDLPVDLALTRQAFMRLDLLSKSIITVTAQPVLHG